jgi:peptidoglycan/LPS O-acetylase OafA/YrhL
MVVAYHYDWLPGGFFGVDVFFVLSGYLITTVLCREWTTVESIDLRKFYSRRLLRLTPALYVFVLVAFVLAETVAGEHLLQPSWAVITLLYGSNLLTAFGGVYPLGFVSHCWSLGLEEQFYLLWPFALRMALRRGVRARTLLVVMVGLALASTLWRLHLAAALADDPDGWLRVYFGPDTRADLLAVGCALALLEQDRPAALALSATWQAVAALGGLALLGLAARTPSIEDAVASPASFTIAALGALLMIVGTKDRAATPVTRFFELAPVVWLGRLSYSLYVWHALALTVAVNALAATPGLSLLAKYTLPLVLAAASYYLVERPFLRLKDRLAVVRVAPVPGKLSAPDERLSAGGERGRRGRV